MAKWENNKEIQIFREYLQIPSVHPNIDYEPCVQFLKKQATDLGLPIAVYHPASQKCPVVVMTWEGLNPALPAILLNSHMDVVPVEVSKWTHPPFAAEIDENGNIFARGAQDMKSVGTQYLGAIRALKQDGVRLQRTVLVAFVPDEEIGGHLGMKAFAPSDEFKALNVGFALDESCAVPLNKTLVFYAERTHRAVELICTGQAGHGSIMQPNTPGEKVQYMVNKFMNFRKNEVQKLADNPKLNMGDVTAVNLTMIQGGVQKNVVPSEMKLTFDIRVAIDVDHDAFDNMISKWCEEAGGGITVNYLMKDPKVPITRIDSSNLFWVAFENAVNELNLEIELWVCPGCTDARYIRALNIPALGFMPQPNTKTLLHDHDEYLNADVYLNGINIYKKIITNLGNV